jgi:hypothetical protein
VNGTIHTPSLIINGDVCDNIFSSAWLSGARVGVLECPHRSSRSLQWAINHPSRQSSARGVTPPTKGCRLRTAAGVKRRTTGTGHTGGGQGRRADHQRTSRAQVIAARARAVPASSAHIEYHSYEINFTAHHTTIAMKMKLVLEEKKILDIRIAHTPYPHQSDPNLTFRPRPSTHSKSPSLPPLVGGCIGGRCL